MTNLLILLTNTNVTTNCNFEFFKAIIPGIFTISGICLAAILTYLFYIKQKKKEIGIKLLQIKYERKLQALEQCWKLLAFTTDTENTKTIVVWEKQGDSEKKYFLIKSNAEAFKKQLPEMFYESGLGLYLSKEIKEQLFQYRSQIFGILLKEKNNSEAKIELQNKELIKKLVIIHEELGRLLRMEKDIIEKEIL